LVRIRILWRT